METDVTEMRLGSSSLRNARASWKTQELPVRTIQLDDWWYVGGETELLWHKQRPRR
jgi:hypothetical protein